jgi:hypothetical protein
MLPLNTRSETLGAISSTVNATFDRRSLAILDAGHAARHCLDRAPV